MHLLASASARKLLVATAVAAMLAIASTPSRAQDEDPPAQAGRLSYVSGTVSIQQVGSDDWGQALPNLPLGPGDRIFTDTNGRAEIQVGQTFLRLGPNSDVSFVDSTPTTISFDVAQGALHVRCYGLWQDQSIHLNTPSGAGVLNHPSELRIDVLPDQSAAIFTSLSDEAGLYGAVGYRQEIYAGQALELVGSNPIYPQWLQPAGPDDLDYWSQRRDQQIMHAASYQYVSHEIPGADELDANGTWQPGTEYGAVWFPNNVPYGWAPYHYGHWVNHAPWGSVWVEDESWGYAPFHYGRWVNYNGRWGWVPGPPAAHPVWSPALVVFAGGIHVGGVSVSAWFPLGPGEAYRPWYHASPRYIDQVNISNMGESRRVHVQTTYVNIVNVTNVTNVTYVNRSNGFTAMRHEDFAAGRPARQAAVVVDAHQFDHVQVLARPEVQPAPHAMMAPPAVRPVPVKTERPAVIDASGKVVSARPGAQAMEPPVRQAPQVKPLPGRVVVAPPPTAKMPAGMPPAATQGTRPAPGAAPTTRPGVAPAPAAPTSMRPTTPPAAMPPVQPSPRPVAPGTQRPAPQSAPMPSAPTSTRPATPPAATSPAQSMPRPVAPGTQRPVTQPAPTPSVPSNTRPAPTMPPSQQNARPVPPTAASPAPQPTGQPVVPPASTPSAQPAPKPAPPAAVKPAVPPAQPTARPVAPPAARPAPQPAVRPVAPPAGRPADKTKDSKPDKPKKDETKPEK